jgi:hypothetical protein
MPQRPNAPWPGALAGRNRPVMDSLSLAIMAAAVAYSSFIVLAMRR